MKPTIFGYDQSMLRKLYAVVLLWFLAPVGGVSLAAGLNDTGIQFCGEADSGNNQPCTGNEPVGQDAHYGRDGAAAAGVLKKDGGEGKGFDLTKIANDGSELPLSANLGNGPNEWACTRDNVTGLIWEVKTDDNGLRDRNWKYTWYNTNSPDGDPGVTGDTLTCGNTLGGEKCNTTNYVTAINGVGLCGFTDWRIPTVNELVSIIDYGRVNPAIDPTFFPDVTDYPKFWSNSPYVRYFLTWYVSFYNGETGNNSRNFSYSIRVVRGH